MDPLLFEHFAKRQEDLCGCARVVHGTVVLELRDPELSCHSIQLVPVERLEKHVRKAQGIHYRGIKFQTKKVRIMADKTDVEHGVVSDNGNRFPVSDKREELRDPVLIVSLSADLVIRDRGQLRDPRRDGTLRVDKLGKTVDDLAFLKLYGTDLNNAVILL